MTEDRLKMVVKTEIAKPLHYQQLEKSLNIEPFLSCVEDFLQQPLGDEGDASSNSETELVGVDEYTGETIWNGVTTSKQDRRADKIRLYNLSSVKNDRRWLQEVLLSDSSDSSGDEEITETDLKNMLREHLLKKKYRGRFYSDPKNRQFEYYGAGLLSNYDKFPEHQMEIIGTKKKKSVSQKKEKAKKPDDSDNYHLEDIHETETGIREEIIEARGRKPGPHKRKVSQAKNAEVMAHKRRKLWAIMAKKELGKVQRSKINNHKEMLTSCRRVANYCMRHWRQKAMQSQKNMKEVVWRAKRLTREMQVYWKRYERVERETRRRMEKEAEEQRKLDVELMEAKRQQRKLNFLITQTELYAHFMSRKLGSASTQEQLRILSQLEEESNPRLASIDDYDCELEKDKVRKRVEKAFTAEVARTREFGDFSSQSGCPGNDIKVEEQDKPQPTIFRGKLKGYQIKGMTWLVNLYDQGINGILADEMGLGKTVQSIAFLCHIAENYSVWGPFLIISPASTLHNWQQEMQRFVPDFKVVPYWGNPQERKILRQFWDQKGIHTKEASFHVVITSYQLVITDFKYFNRIKWQYMILDEAQAIKSTSSMRWKLLLGFNCRNRLLLSGTPIQNSMAELWALLHFIMPTMFDSHDEFNEWFSKDIESHAENKTSIDEKHLSRLHMILKPFMLRRIKMDVENELSDKIEVMVYCPLTTRQKMLYSALKKKIRIEDLLHSSGPYQSAQSITSNLMNLVMQFRKVCNHPELFERREARSPLNLHCEDYIVPRLITDEGLLYRAIPSKHHILYNMLSIFSPAHIHASLFPRDEVNKSSSCFSFSRFTDLTPMELYRLAIGGLLQRWLHLSEKIELNKKWDDRMVWGMTPWPRLWVRPLPLPSDVVFTSYTSDCIFTHTTVALHSIPETLEHRLMRSRKKQESAVNNGDENGSRDSGAETEKGVTLLPVFPHTPLTPTLLHVHPVTLPSFLNNSILKVNSCGKMMYSWGSRSWAWAWEHHMRCENVEGRQCVYFGSPELAKLNTSHNFTKVPLGGLIAATPTHGWSSIVIPDKQTLVTDAGKLYVLDNLLKRLKQQGHRVLIYSQMTKMIDLLEEYMWFRKHTYMRLDGSSKISDRRDMVADFQNRADIFVFLLSTRAGGLGINLTAADTVIFYDSDWNPTVDQQAMDRAHRLGQTKQVTVYRLICKGTIEERILQRAREKSEIQRMVISGGNFKPDTLKPKEVVSLLLDDAEIEQKYRLKQAERRMAEENRQDIYRERDRERKRKQLLANYKDTVKHIKTEDGIVEVFQGELAPQSPAQSEGSGVVEDGNLEIDVSSEPPPIKLINQERTRAKRGRPPRGANRRGALSRPPPTQFSHMPPIALGSGGSLLSGGRNLSSGVKRGPGRPRLKPAGPAHQGSRGNRGLRRPLPVPIRPQPKDN